MHQRHIKSHMHVFWASRMTWRSLWLQWPSRIRKRGFSGDGWPHLTNSFGHARNILMFMHPSCWRTATAPAGALVNFAHGKMKIDGIQWHSRRTMTHCDLSPDVDLPICNLTLTESTALFVWTNDIPVASVLNMRDGTKGHFCIPCSTPREITRTGDCLSLMFSINIYSAFCKLNRRWLLIN